MDNGLTFKLFKVEPDGTRFETPLKQFLDASGNLNDTALVDAFPHPSTDAPDRTILVATDFRNAEGSPMFIPADAVTASASGLDPHISPANASIQAVRIASQRKVSIAQVNTLIDQNTDRPVLGLLGDSGVNVLRLNLALDRQYPVVR
ncbi:MAG: potassium-transporting ATPase subunit C [Phycisphaerae bacterium]|nr:potassium-transporting ATPase subunit C [Phycisphaerae bacterium]